MTWSIVAREPSTGRYAVAVATCAFAVGARVPFGGGRVGAVATQALVNPLYGVDGMRLLAEGRTADEIVAILTAADPGAAHRQLHLLDAQGRGAAHTGSQCVPWCGRVAAEGVSVAGNMLAGPEVVEETLRSFLAHDGADFDDRLLTALEAGEKAGGDKRGRQSAALRVWDTEPFPAVDIRVDDHADPLGEMRRLWRIAHQRYVPFQACGPTRANPAGVIDRDELDAKCTAAAAAWNARHPG